MNVIALARGRARLLADVASASVAYVLADDAAAKAALAAVEAALGKLEQALAAAASSPSRR